MKYNKKHLSTIWNKTKQNNTHKTWEGKKQGEQHMKKGDEKIIRKKGCIKDNN